MLLKVLDYALIFLILFFITILGLHIWAFLMQIISDYLDDAMWIEFWKIVLSLTLFLFAITVAVRL